LLINICFPVVDDDNNIRMLILFETAAGFALFRADKPKKLEKV
jgi:hypothetical protein